MKKLKMILAAVAVAGVTALPMASAEAFFWPFGGWGGPWGGYPGWGGGPWGGPWGGYPGHWGGPWGGYPGYWGGPYGGYPGYWGGYPYGGYPRPYAYPYAAPAAPQSKSAE